MPHSFSYAVSMNLEYSIKEESHERYPDHFQCFRNIKKKYPDFQAMTFKLSGMLECIVQETRMSFSGRPTTRFVIEVQTLCSLTQE